MASPSRSAGRKLSPIAHFVATLPSTVFEVAYMYVLDMQALFRYPACTVLLLLGSSGAGKTVVSFQRHHDPSAMLMEEVVRTLVPYVAQYILTGGNFLV